MKNWEKVLDFIATTENISYLHSPHTKSKTQQLMGGKLTLSQPKSGQMGIERHLLGSQILHKNDSFYTKTRWDTFHLLKLAVIA